MTRSRILTALFALFIFAAFVQPAAAHYDPKLGRWLERDPRSYIDSSNLYQYTLGNPVRWTDSKGLVAGPPDPPPPGWTSKPEYIGSPTKTYCRAAKKYPNNDWLQCVCRVSQEVNSLIEALRLGTTPIFAPGVHDDRASIRRAMVKANWFECMNNCIERKWLAGYKVFQGDPLNPGESAHLIDAWRDYCKDCPTANAAVTKKCCEKQVEAEQQGFEACKKTCGTYNPTWGPPAGDMTEKVMPGWDPKADFNDYDERVKFGKKLCCVDKHRLNPPGGGQPPPE